MFCYFHHIVFRAWKRIALPTVTLATIFLLCILFRTTPHEQFLKFLRLYFLSLFLQTSDFCSAFFKFLSKLTHFRNVVQSKRFILDKIMDRNYWVYVIPLWVPQFLYLYFYFYIFHTTYVIFTLYARRTKIKLFQKL